MIRSQTLQDMISQEKLVYKTPYLRKLDMVAKYSFVAHKSIDYLDLSLCEFSSLKEKSKVFVKLIFCSADPAYLKKFVCTAEGCRKTLIPERRWLYTYHLDLARGRESDYLTLGGTKQADIWGSKSICLNTVIMQKDLYKKPFREFIKTSLDEKNMEIPHVRRYIALVKHIFGVRPYENGSIEETILKYLLKKCTDSEVVKEFLGILDFRQWVRTDPTPDVLIYLIHHAYESRYDLKLNDTKGTVVNECFFNTRFKTCQLLLTYQNAPFYSDYDSCILIPAWMRNIPEDWHLEDLDIPYKEEILSTRRYLLCMQLFHAYIVRDLPPSFGSVAGTLRLLWKTIPDNYFTLKELLNAYEGTSVTQDIIKVVHNYYVEAMGKDYLIDMPRPLKHFSRTCVRRALSNNIQLPFGIKKLPLPQKLCSYLTFDE